MEAPNEPAEKEHPSLVKQALLDSLGRPHIVAIMGTSNTARSGPEFYAMPDKGRWACDLRRSTSFNLLRELRIPWAAEFYFGSPDTPPGTRRLPEDVIRDFQVFAAHFANGRLP